MMTTSTQNLESAEAILDDVRRDRARQARPDATASIQLATAYIGLAAIKVTIATQEVLRASMEHEGN